MKPLWGQRCSLSGGHQLAIHAGNGFPKGPRQGNRACAHAHTHKHVHACTHARMHTHTHAQTHTHKHVHTCTHAHTRTNTCTRACTNTRAHACTSPPSSPGRLCQPATRDSRGPAPGTRTRDGCPGCTVGRVLSPVKTSTLPGRARRCGPRTRPRREQAGAKDCASRDGTYAEAWERQSHGDRVRAPTGVTEAGGGSRRT